MSILGIDIGGTFTDLVLMDEGGNISTAKAPTTPGELEKGVFDAVAVAAKAQGLGPEELLGRVQKSFAGGRAGVGGRMASAGCNSTALRTAAIAPNAAATKLIAAARTISPAPVS